jgi:hypothetical protein
MHYDGMISGDEKAAMKNLILSQDPNFKAEFERAERTGNLAGIRGECGRLEVIVFRSNLGCAWDVSPRILIRNSFGCAVLECLWMFWGHVAWGVAQLPDRSFLSFVGCYIYLSRCQ